MYNQLTKTMELLIPRNIPFSDSQSVFAHEMEKENV